MFISTYVVLEAQVSDIRGNEEKSSVSDPVVTHIRERHFLNTPTWAWILMPDLYRPARCVAHNLVQCVLMKRSIADMVLYKHNLNQILRSSNRQHHNSGRRQTLVPLVFCLSRAGSILQLERRATPPERNTPARTSRRSSPVLHPSLPVSAFLSPNGIHGFGNCILSPRVLHVSIL
jgi:hypothetical protein